MTLVPLDVLLVLIAVASLIAGFQTGLVARVAAWGAGLLGILAAVHLTPVVLARLPDVEPTLRLAAVAGLGLVVLLTATALGAALGRRWHRGIRRHGLIGGIDRIAGAVSGVAVLALLVWLLAPVAANVPGLVAQQARDSTLIATLERLAPPPPDAVAAARRLVDTSGFPAVLADLEPSPELGPPPDHLPIPGARLTLAAASTVRIESRGCNRTMSGTGFVVAPGQVVTNAHVVAGGTTLIAHRDDLVRFDAELVSFDGVADLALLTVPGLDRPALPLAVPELGAEGAVIGHPSGQRQQRIAPARIDRQRRAIGRDIHDLRPAERDILVLAADLQRGDSGSAVLDADGAVVGVVFAISPDRPATAFALDRTELDGFLAGPPQRREADRCLA